MREGQLIQRSGLAALIGGLMLPIYQLLHPERDAATVLSTPYTLVHILGVLALTHILFGLVGLYARQKDRLGRYGTEAFILAFFGTALWAGALWLDAFLNPVMALTIPTTHTEGHGSNAVEVFGALLGPAVILLPLSSLLVIAGNGWFAIATARARIMPRLAALVVVPGAMLFGAGLYVSVGVETVGGFLMGSGYAWMGYRLWSDANYPDSLPASTDPACPPGEVAAPMQLG